MDSVSDVVVFEFVLNVVHDLCSLSIKKGGSSLHCFPNSLRVGTGCGHIAYPFPVSTIMHSFYLKN